MAWSSSILAYPDIEEYLNTALSAPNGIRIDFDSIDPKDLQKKCTTFVFRCNAYRKIMRTEAKKLLHPSDPKYGLTDYDRLKISDKKDHVRIEFWKNLRLKVTELPVDAIT